MPEDALKCPACGTSFDQTSGATAFMPPEKEKAKSSSIHSTESADGARFAAGTMLADRYRIISLLGRGGMGEVYKAEDLRLKQIVALKLLPEAIALDGAALARFQNEVRITRQISHPNVCRVYDIGEADGIHFLSMEHIDGEDLSLLLRRIGRLPGDKATEIARQICAGLAAAHDNGVLHRDLKPANIMIDGRGKARVTDFGIAVVGMELQGREAASGTPAYMAPEQLKGKEVTQKSDIYSLGLVLYELFTGKPVYSSDNLQDLMKLHESSTPTSPASLINDLDPLVERVIMRCLEKDPSKRPASAIQVAAALPGGDPLAAALAAGETPSPEMVAASGAKTGLRPALAVTLLISIIVGLAICAFLGSKANWVAKLTRENSPDSLTIRSREIIRQLGYTDKPADSASGFTADNTYLTYVNENSPTVDRWDIFTKAQPAPLYFWYRQSPRYLEPTDFKGFGWVRESDPSLRDISGLVTINLDTTGRLTWFVAVPPQVDNLEDKPPPPNWTALLDAAGFDPAAFTLTESTWTPETPYDTRAAWTGVYPDAPDIPIRIEAAAYRGKPVYFFIVTPWTYPWMNQAFQGNTGQNIGTAILLGVILCVILGAALLARNNLRRGRGDRRGAFRLALIVFSFAVFSWLFGAGHVPTINEVFRFLLIAVSQALFLSGVFWLLYIALEPYVRRRWPDTIITWSRVLGGSLADPLVGRDVLIAVLGGVLLSMSLLLESLVRQWAGAAPQPSGQFEAWITVRKLIAIGFLSNANASIGLSLFLFFLIFLLRVFTRRQWLTAAIFIGFWVVMDVLRASDPMIAEPFVFFVNAVAVTLILRFGLLTLAAALFVQLLLDQVALTTDFSAWYSDNMIVVLVAVLALAVWAFHTSLGGQKVFNGGLLEE